MTIDVSEALAAFTALAAAITAVGAAKLGPAGIAVAFKWVKGAIFG